MVKINYIGLKDFSDIEQGRVTELAERYCTKIDRKYPDAVVDLHIKAINTEGKEKHYFIKIRVAAPSLKFEAEQDDWDLSRTMHKVFENIENEINKK